MKKSFWVGSVCLRCVDDSSGCDGLWLDDARLSRNVSGAVLPRSPYYIEGSPYFCRMAVPDLFRGEWFYTDVRDGKVLSL